MPPISVPILPATMMVKAAIAFVLLGLGIGGCIKAVGFTNDFYNNRAETPLPPPGHSLGVEFGPNSGSDSCPTCLFVGSEDTLLDYYGKPIDVERLLYNTPTSILPLKTSYADHSTMNPKPTSTPPSNPDVVLCPVPTGTSSASTPFSKPTAHPPPASTLETTLGWLEFFLSWWFFPLQMVIYLAIGIATSGLVTQRSWGIFWLVASRFATSMLSKAAMAWIQRLQKNREIQRAKVTSSKAKTQLTIGTDAAQNAMVEDMTAIIHEHYQDPAKMMWAILGLLVARYGDACILTFSEEAFAPIVINDSDYMMSGVLQDDDHVNQEDERPVWPIGFFNYQPPLLSHLNVGDEEVDQDEYACNRYAALGMGPKQRATHALTWREWQIAYLEAGYGTPEDPDAKLNPTPAPVIPTDETSDAAIARQIHEDELTIWRRDCISRYETEAAELRVIIAKLRARTLLSYSDGDEVEGASEQSRHHVPQDDDAETLNEDELEGRTGVKDADKQDNQFAASPDPTEGDEDAALAKKLQQQYDAENNLSWHRWQIEYLEAGHGTPEDPHAKPDPPASPAPIVGEISDAAIARQLHEEELAVWRRDRILLHAAKVPMLQARIASLSAELNDVMPGADTHDAVNGESQAPHGGDTASP